MEAIVEPHASALPMSMISAANSQETDSNRLLVLIADGDISAFWNLWTRYQNHLSAVCFAEMRGNRADAEDALSNAMIRALEKLPYHASEILNPKAWLTRLTSNQCKEMHRERARRENNLGKQFRYSIGPLEQSPQLRDSPEESIFRREMAERAARGINSLPSTLRDPFLLRLKDELPCLEIGAKLELSCENVRKRLQLARGILKDQLQQYASGSRAKRLALASSNDPRPSGVSRGPARRTACSVPGRRERVEATPKILQPHLLRTVQITLCNGVEIDYCLVLDRKPGRERCRIRTLERYCASHPTGWKKRIELARLLGRLGRWEDAMPHYRYVTDKRPFLLNAWLHLGNMLQATYRTKEAISVYQSALARSSDPATRHRISGMICLCDNDPARAVGEFETAAALQPDILTHWYLWGIASNRARSFDRSLGPFAHILTTNPGDPLALVLNHDALKSLGRIDHARRQLERALDFNPNNVPGLRRAIADRCDNHLVRGTEGRKTYLLINRLLQFDPESAQSQYLTSVFHWSRGDIDNAVSTFTTYASGQPRNPRAWYLLSKLLRLCGDRYTSDGAMLTAMNLYRLCRDSAGGSSGNNGLHQSKCSDKTLAEMRRTFEAEEFVLDL
ncbi:MAG: sigma-70 family RNA polymerase sigma factor [Blastocatellia bacterium]